MSNLSDFLTSSEALIVYMVAGLSMCLCIIIYIVEKNNVKLRQKHNTKELNKLVSQIQEEMPEVVEEPNYEVPVLQVIEDQEESTVSEMLTETQEVILPEVEEVKEEVVEPKEELHFEYEPIDILAEAEEELEYTSIEPDRETAREELRKLTEELERQAEEQEQVIENEKLTDYEELQEENAIISMDELLQKSRTLYEKNEEKQYLDDGDEPISLHELEERLGVKISPQYENFDIQEVVEDEVEETVPEVQPVKVEEEKKWKSSPIISPIFGIEKEPDEKTELALENTANYEKLDQEIKKTNEFLMTLKDLQEKL